LLAVDFTGTRHRYQRGPQVTLCGVERDLLRVRWWRRFRSVHGRACAVCAVRTRSVERRRFRFAEPWGSPDLLDVRRDHEP
jgi:hypothetical protein